MAWNLNPNTVGVNYLGSIFTDGGYVGANYPVGLCKVFSGTMPTSPTVTTGITALTGDTDCSLSFYPPSDGVTILGSNIVFTATATGTASFIRFYDPYNTPVYDVSASTSASIDTAVLSTLSVTTGNQFTLTNLRLKMAVTGDVSVSPGVANDFLYKMIGYTPTYGLSPKLFSNNDPAGSYLGTDQVTYSLYTGAIPTRADLAPTGTLVWTKTPTDACCFIQVGLGISLLSNLSANAVASGTPTYLRVRRSALTLSGYGTLPEAIIQVPVATTGSGCTLSASTFTSGQSYSITGLTLTL